MSTQTHTETPWKIEPLIEALSTIDTSQEHVKANAEFIVRACNGHEELVKALELCVDALEFIPCRARNEAIQALALVK